uniref:Uncharacterized protein n=1 Tax=Setaria italica TaxID=4555 RepID=K3YF47_SETIT
MCTRSIVQYRFRKASVKEIHVSTLMQSNSARQTGRARTVTRNRFITRQIIDSVAMLNT